MFHDPDTLHVWIDVFFTVAAASVVFAVIALTIGIRDLRRPTPASAGPIGPVHGVDATSTSVRQAA
jgi:heme/copper-type cytochrome/quinol oxidase subunit 1